MFKQLKQLMDFVLFHQMHFSCVFHVHHTTNSIVINLAVYTACVTQNIKLHFMFLFIFFGVMHVKLCIESNKSKYFYIK